MTLPQLNTRVHNPADLSAASARRERVRHPRPDGAAPRTIGGGRYLSSGDATPAGWGEPARVQLVTNHPEQTVDGERLEQEWLSPVLESETDRIRPVRVARQEEHTGLRVRLDELLGQREPVHNRHHDIDNLQVDRTRMVCSKGERLLAIAGFQQLVPPTFECPSDETSQRRIVLGEQDRLAGRSGCHAPP